MAWARRSTAAIARSAAIPSTGQASLIRTLAQLRAAEARCTCCPLDQFATQVVPGEGPIAARLMLVGEQPR
jgi:uracil-DNA glycosylase